MPTVKEVQASFIAKADGFLAAFKPVEKTLENLPKLSEKATDKMNKDFSTVEDSLVAFNDQLKKTGKDFDTKNVQVALQQAQKEFKETGNVTKDTMKNLNKEIQGVEWKSLDINSRTAFKQVITGAKDMEKQMNKLNDLNFLEGLPDDAKKAGLQLVNLGEDVTKLSKKLNSIDDKADFNNLHKGLADARKEIVETGKVSDATMKSIENDVKAVNFDSLGNEAEKAKDKITKSFSTLDSEIKNATNIKGGGGLSGEFKEADKQVGLLGGSLGKLSGVLGTVFAAVSVVDFTKSIVDATAEVKALNSQYEQVMGDMKNTTDKYLGEMAQKYNVHPNELKKSMLQYQAILKGKGLSEEEAYKTSQKWLERTVDGSSFANESIEQTTERMMGIIKGNRICPSC